MNRFWKPIQKLAGPGYFYGRTESGKTWKLVALSQIYNSKFRYKIFDISGGKYNEGPFWCFKSEEKILWDKFKNKVGEMSQEGPKEYKVKLLYPCFTLKLPEKLPQHLPRIQTKVFSIYFKDITTEDIAMVTGDLSKNSIYFWNQILKNVKNDASAQDIHNYVERNLKKYMSLSIYRLFLKPALENNLIDGKGGKLNIDLIQEAKEKDIISVLCHDYIPNKIWQMFIMYHIMRRLLFDLAMNDKIPKENIALFREAGDYMKKIDKDLEAGEQVQIFRNKLTQVARYGRRGLILFMDTQSPSDTKNLIEGQEDLLCINEISILDLKDIIDKLRTERRLPRKIKDRLHNLEQSEMIIIERKKKAILVSPFMPPRCMCFKKDNFMKVWKEKINIWVNTNEYTSLITPIKIEDNIEKITKEDKIEEMKEELNIKEIQI